MARRSRHAQNSSGLISLGAVGVVAALAGILFATNARLGNDEGRGNPDLHSLVADQNAAVDSLMEQDAELSKQIDDLIAQIQGEADIEADTVLAGAAGRLAVEGPGLVIELNDAKAPANLPAGTSNDALVVHQQDLEAVINALWAGGAEAISVQGQRLTSVSAIRCVGNVLYIAGRTESPPYVIAAIGDSHSMLAALENSKEVQAYRWAVDNLGLGWSASQESTLRIDGYPRGSIGIRYATTVAAAAPKGGYETP